MNDLDRRLLIIGHWGPEGTSPNHSKVQGVVGRLQRALGPNGRYPFSPMSGRSGEPDVLFNPSDGELTSKLADEPEGVNDDTLLFVYYVGHAVGSGENDLRLRLRYRATEGAASHKNLSTLLNQIRDAGFSKLVLGLDCCHAGRTLSLAADLPMSNFIMLGTGKGYAFNCDFTEGILNTLERAPHKRDQRIDRMRKGFTFERLFEGARARFVQVSGEKVQMPISHSGGLEYELLANAPVRIPIDYNPHVPSRSVYGRIYIALELLRDKPVLKLEFPNLLKTRNEFVVEYREDGKNRYIRTERAFEYCQFLLDCGLVKQQNSEISLSELGLEALNSRYNEVLLESIARNILSNDLGYGDLDGAVDSLIRDMIPPTPPMIAERLRNKGIFLDLTPSTRIALTALPATGRYLKSASDALFPSDPELAT